MRPGRRRRQRGAARHAAAGLRFIHVEIYEDNDPAKGENRWVREWKLPSEPWVFLVGADGKIRDALRGHGLASASSTTRSARLQQRGVVSGVFRPGKPARWAMRARRRGARSRSVASRAAASCCASSARSARRRPAGDPRGRAGVPAGPRGARHDLRQARAAALVAAGPAPGRLHRGARAARRRRAAVPVRGGAADHRRGDRARASSRGSTRSRSPPPRSPRSTARCSAPAARSSSRCGGPGIEEQVALDLELLRSLTSFAEGRSETARLLQLSARSPTSSRRI